MFTGEIYTEMFALVYSGRGNPSAWIEKDGQSGFTSEDEEVTFGDEVDPSVVVRSQCAQAYVYFSLNY